MMTREELRGYVTLAVDLDRKISTYAETLKEMKKAIVAEAKRYPNECQAIPDGGKSIAFDGKDGCIARVTFPKPTLKSSIAGESETLLDIRRLVGNPFDYLFRQQPAYVPVDGFREKAEKVLGSASARQLLKICTTKSQTRVSFETKPAEDLKQ